MTDSSIFLHRQRARRWAAVALTLVLFHWRDAPSKAADAALRPTLERGAIKMVEGRPSSFSISLQTLPFPMLKTRKLSEKVWFGTSKIAGREFLVAFYGSDKAPDHVIADTNWNRQFDSSDAVAELAATDSKEDSALLSSPITTAIPGALETPYSLRLGMEAITHWTEEGVEKTWKGTLRSAGWASGTMRWNSREIRVGVQDDNSNGRFDDPFQARSQGDLFFFDWNGDGQFAGSREVLRAGRFVFADDHLCAVTVATGGARLNLQPVIGGTGLFQCEPSVREIHFLSQNGLLVAPLHEGSVRLPNGTYSLLLWIARKTADDRHIWEMKAGCVSPPKIVIGATPTQLKLIAALNPALSIDRQQNGLRFSLAVGTTGGDTLLRLAPANEQGQAPQLRLLDVEGRPFARIRLNPEGQAAFGALWQPPVDAPDLLRARLEFDHGPFEAIEAPDWEFSVPKPPAN